MQVDQSVSSQGGAVVCETTAACLEVVSQVIHWARGVIGHVYRDRILGFPDLWCVFQRARDCDRIVRLRRQAVFRRFEIKDDPRVPKPVGYAEAYGDANEVVDGPDVFVMCDQLVAGVTVIRRVMCVAVSCVVSM